MMNERRRIVGTSFAGLFGISTAALLVACSGYSSSPASAPPPTGAYPPAYAAGPGYATATPAYNAPPGYAATPPAYAAPQAAYTAPPPGYPGTPQPAPQGYTQFPGGPAPAPTAGQPQAAPLAATDPNSLQGILQGLQTAMMGTVIPGGTAMPGDLTEAGLRAYALKVAPSMQTEGDLLKQNLTEGQHAVMMVTLQAGKCYSIVGFSLPGAVKDLDLNLLAPPLYMTLAGQDLTHNNTPTIGASPSPMCPVIAYPLQYKLDVFAKSGSGAVAVQLYSKAKS